jgi:hypothetical protein
MTSTKPFDSKSEEIKETIEAVFPGTKEAIENKKCPMCKQSIRDFRDSLSIKEYLISGLCQHCQDDIFG